MTRSWLGRLAFSFLVIGIFLAWQSIQAANGKMGPVSTGRIILYMVGATFSFVLGFVGVRERHKRQ